MRRPLSNPFGDIRAEADHHMLSQAFYETPDYLSLLDSDDKVVVVGRRGTGKSALTYKLSARWRQSKSDILIVIAPDEHHTLAIEPFIARAGESFLHTRAACRMLWKYGILLEVAFGLSAKYKIKEKIADSEIVNRHLSVWVKTGDSFYDRLRITLKHLLNSGVPSDEMIAHLAESLEIPKIERDIATALKLGCKAHIVVDRLDEGFNPTQTNIAFIDGAVSAAGDLGSSLRSHIRPLIFLRDNIYRAVAHYDQDYARNIEGQTLRLHWDVNNLFYLVCNRIRAAFKDDLENNKRLWNKYVSYELQGEEGFKLCLRYTLYRPRDILILLNSAFENSSKRDLTSAHATIALEDIEKSAKIISMNRLDDLTKEYKQIFPTINRAVSSFEGGNTEMPMAAACAALEAVISDPPSDQQSQLELAILERPEELVRSLYSVGFFGSHDIASNSFVFSHDGKRPDVEFNSAQRLLVHPCYWMALNLSSTELNADQATEINDEYEIKVASATPAIRTSRLNKLMSEYLTIALGDDATGDFEQWCLEAVRICFAGRLDNSHLEQNKSMPGHRNIVGNNLSVPPVWKGLRETHDVKQAVFAIKNEVELVAEDYSSLRGGMTGEHGRLAFVICRSATINLERGHELDWFKKIYSDTGVIVVKLTAKFLSDILGKLRNPKKHYAPDQLIGGLLDTYEHLYLMLPSSKSKKRSARTLLRRN